MDREKKKGREKKQKYERGKEARKKLLCIEKQEMKTALKFYIKEASARITYRCSRLGGKYRKSY